LPAEPSGIGRAKGTSAPWPRLARPERAAEPASQAASAHQDAPVDLVNGFDARECHGGIQFPANDLDRPGDACLATNTCISDDAATHLVIDWWLGVTGFNPITDPAEDIATIQTVYSVFHEAGPGVNYATRSSSPAMFGAGYPNYGMLQTATNADSVPMAFLANEANYRAVRELELRNLIMYPLPRFGSTPCSSRCRVLTIRPPISAADVLGHRSTSQSRQCCPICIPCLTFTYA